MSNRIWKIELMSKPSITHAADAVEIVDGEAVRRVTLPPLDLDVYRAHEKLKAELARAPYAHELMTALPDALLDEIEATLRRLAASGLIADVEKQMLQ